MFKVFGRERSDQVVVRLDDGIGQVSLPVLEFQDALFDGVFGHEAIGENFAGLTDAVRAVNRLRFDGRIPNASALC